jgi:hypothetical protein
MDKLLSRFASLLALLVTGAAGGTMITACGRTTSVVAPSAESTMIDAGPDHAAANVFANDTKKVVFTVKGGFVAPAPQGSSCRAVDIGYTLLLPARELSWTICTSRTGGPLAYESGKKVLSEAEYAPVETALRGLKKTLQKQACGADKPEQAITFTTSAGEKTYVDDFYFCAEDGKHYVAGLDDLLTELTKISQ